MGCELFLVVCSRSSGYFATVLRPFLCIFIWYSLSMLVAVLNDWYMEVNGFDFPIYLSMNHMVVIFLGAYTLKHTNWYTRIYFNTDLNDEDCELHVAYRGFSSWREAAVKVGAMSVLTAASVALYNMSLDYMDITAVEVISSTSVLIVLLVSVGSRQEPLSLLLCLSVLCIVAGAVYSSYQDIRGEPLGFIFAAVATVSSAINVVLMYSMLRSYSYAHTPLDLMVYFSLPVVLLLSVPFVIFELPTIINSDLNFPFFYTLLLVASESVLFFFMTWSALILIDMTSAITFEVLGTLRQVFVFLAALLFFRERLTRANVVGNVIIVCGMILYALSRTGVMQRGILSCGKCVLHRLENYRQRYYLSPAVEPLEENWTGI